MRVEPLASGLISALALSALLVACSEGPTSPGIAPPNATGSPLPVRVEIVGPSSVAPGETVQFSMRLHLSDGTSRDVTKDANWQSRAPFVFSVGSNGMVTGQQVGDGNLFGLYQAEGALNAMKEIIVVTSGTYRLTGIVSEAEAPVPLPGALVEVESRVGTLSTRTDNEGRYRLYGVAGTTQLRVTKNGYELMTRELSVQDHDIQNFELRIASPRIDVAGTYALTLTAADSCQGTLPAEAMRRTYTAAIVQRGPQLGITLTGATFVNNRTGRGSSFSGRIEPTLLAFTLNVQPYYNYYPYVPDYYPDIVEQLSTGYLVVSGTVVAQASGGRISGPLSGSIAIWPMDPRTRQSPTTTCASTSHQFALTR